MCKNIKLAIAADYELYIDKTHNIDKYTKYSTIFNVLILTIIIETNCILSQK